MNNIILCGFMGCGKTTVGTLLARRLGMEYAAVSYTHLTLPTN